MKVKIWSVTDLNGILKHEYMIGDTRKLPVLQVGEPMYLFHIGNENKFTRTSLVTGIENGFCGCTNVYTMNSIYELEYLDNGGSNMTVLDILLRRFETMSDEEIINATNYEPLTEG